MWLAPHASMYALGGAYATSTSTGQPSTVPILLSANGEPSLPRERQRSGKTCPADFDVPVLLLTAIVFLTVFAWAGLIHLQIRNTVYRTLNPALVPHETDLLALEVAAQLRFALFMSLLCAVGLWAHRQRTRQLKREGCLSPTSSASSSGGSSRPSPKPSAELAGDMSDDMFALAGIL